MKKQVTCIAFILMSLLIFCACKNAETEVEPSAAASVNDTVNAEHLSENTKESQIEQAGENALLYNSISFHYDGTAGEAIEDLYRPKGYHNRVNTVLAMKMALHTDDPQYRYHVVLHVPTAWTMDEVLSRVSQQTRETYERWLNVRDPLLSAIIEATGKSEQEALSDIDRLGLQVSEYFYYMFTAEQIEELAKAGFRCSYVGSGEGELPSMDWENDAFIDAFCEKNGDLFTAARDGTVECSPFWDIQVVDGEIVSIEFILA